MTKHKEEKEEKKRKKVVYCGSHRANFFYQASLPANVDPKKAKAEVEDGIIIISLPKTEESKPQAIPVTTKKK